MLRYLLAPLAALILLTASLIPMMPMLAVVVAAAASWWRRRLSRRRHAWRRHARGTFPRWRLSWWGASVTSHRRPPGSSRIWIRRSSRSSGLPGRGPRVLSRIWIRRGGSRSGSGWCRGVWRLWRLQQQLLRRVRQLDLCRVSLLSLPAWRRRVVVATPALSAHELDASARQVAQAEYRRELP